MKKDKVKVEVDVAYLCNGKDRSCTKESCYYRNHGSCMHTTNPKSEKFDKYSVELYGIKRVRYYEREEGR